MSVHKPKGSRFWQYDFQSGGNRFLGSTKRTTRREAEKVEDRKRDEAKALTQQLRAAEANLTFHHCSQRYWLEVGVHHKNADTTLTNIKRLEGYLGKDKMLSTIKSDDVTKLVAWRRGHHVKGKKNLPLVSAATVNRSTVQLLQAIFTRARKHWGASFGQEPVWGNHRLKEPQERIRELSDTEADAIEDNTRPDYVPFFSFVGATGMRLNECILKWSEVNWSAKTISKSGKGERAIIVPITDEVRDILLPLRGHHPEMVFTYVASRTRKPQGLVKGRRYPVTYSGVKSAWKAIRESAGLPDFRFHDFRHDVGTKLLRETGNLKLVQKALNHADIKTTTKYAHVLNAEVADAMSRVQKSRRKSRNRLKEVV